jgi:hypothetical protein
VDINNKLYDVDLSSRRYRSSIVEATAISKYSNTKLEILHYYDKLLVIEGNKLTSKQRKARTSLPQAIRASLAIKPLFLEEMTVLYHRKTISAKAIFNLLSDAASVITCGFYF